MRPEFEHDVVRVPSLALVVLIGDGQEPEEFARTHFAPEEIVPPDTFKVAERLARSELSAVNAGNLGREARMALAREARRQYVEPIALVLGAGPGLATLRQEGYGRAYALSAGTTVAVERVPLACDRRADAGPFDVIGDVHGCLAELTALLERLGWARDARGAYTHPAGRKLVFLGDLCDRGPDTPGVLRLVLDVLDAGRAYWVPGNHDDKFYRALQGRAVKVTHGLEISLGQMDALPPAERAALAARYSRAYETLPAHLVLAGGGLVAVHAGIRAAMIGHESPGVHAFALYGDVTGDTDAGGHPVRKDWALEYRGQALVVYGHTVTPGARFVGRTINLDQGAVFGGALSALRYPEGEVVSVPAARVYYVKS